MRNVIWQKGSCTRADAQKQYQGFHGELGQLAIRLPHWASTELRVSLICLVKMDEDG